MRELIALRAKLDLIKSDIQSDVPDGYYFRGEYRDGYMDGLTKATDMVSFILISMVVF
jgi:hypothetical protein